MNFMYVTKLQAQSENKVGGRKNILFIHTAFDFAR
jgi:hypothetical protein